MAVGFLRSWQYWGESAVKGQGAFDSRHIAPIPRISLQAFCESEAIAGVIAAAARDRRMERAHVSVHRGGLNSALRAFRGAATPDVIVLDTTASRHDLASGLESLAECCDPGTKVVVVGRSNDILLYRELLECGVSEYLVAPLDVIEFIRTISRLYAFPGAPPVGKIVAVTGAKGGTGASTVAHNIAFSAARDLDIQTVLVDMDLGFGTAGLNYNQDPPQGIAEAVFAPDRIDENLVDRLLTKCGEKLSILAAPATLDRTYDFEEIAFDTLADILRGATPCVILDVPHGWTAWTRRVLVHSEEIVIAATPDLASLRNTKNLLDTLHAARAHDGMPTLVMNLVGMPRRPEITVSDFAKAVGITPAAIIPFEPKLFGVAANNGQMIAETEPGGKTAAAFTELTKKIAGRNVARKAKRNLLDPLMARFSRRKAS